MRKLLLLSLTVATITACHFSTSMGDEVKGSGKRTTEKRQLGDFTAVQVDGAYEVKISVGSRGDVQIDADDNILPLIKTTVKDGRLIISSEQKFSVGSSPIVSLSAKNIHDVSGNGASKFDVSGVQGTAFNVTAVGATKFHCTGQTNKLTVDISGAGSVEARELQAKDVVVKSNGAASAVVFASETLEADINGVGSVDYYGNPKTVNKKINGMGTLNAK